MSVRKTTVDAGSINHQISQLAGYEKPFSPCYFVVCVVVSKNQVLFHLCRILLEGECVNAQLYKV